MSQIKGIIMWARHGDRQGFYQDPITYTASATSITPLGEVCGIGLDSVSRLEGSHVRTGPRVPARRLHSLPLSHANVPIVHQHHVPVVQPSAGPGSRRCWWRGRCHFRQLHRRYSGLVPSQCAFSPIFWVQQRCADRCGHSQINNTVILANGTTVPSPLGGTSFRS